MAWIEHDENVHGPTAVISTNAGAIGDVQRLHDNITFGARCSPGFRKR